MAEQFGDKTHEATPHRRQKAREQGQIAKSQDLTSAMMLIVGVSAIMWTGQGTAEWFGNLAQKQLGGEAWIQADQEFIISFWQDMIGQIARMLLPILGLLMLTAIASNLGQIGFLFLPAKVGFDVSRINPMSGLKRLFSITSAMRLAFGIVKVVIVGLVGLASLWSRSDEILGITAGSPLLIAGFVTEVVLWTCLRIGTALLILALLDYGFQKWKSEQDMRMTHQEMKDEIKQLQGDPQLIARRRSIQRQLILNRMNTSVPTADVVVTNPTELAIAIQYDPESMSAPVVVAKGAGVLAQRIRRLALENNVPIVERKELARALYKEVEVNQTIPAEQYAAMAQVLKYVYELKGKTLPTMDAA